jgi:hypothetical protein
MRGNITVIVVLALWSFVQLASFGKLKYNKWVVLILSSLYRK